MDMIDARGWDLLIGFFLRTRNRVSISSKYLVR